MPVNISELSDTFKTITGKNAVTEEKKKANMKHELEKLTRVLEN